MQRRPGPLAALGFNLASLALAVPTSVVLAMAFAGGVTAFTGIGLIILIITLPLLRGLAAVQRRMVGAALGGPVTRRYADLRGLSPQNRVKTWITDSALWADVGWALFTCTIGVLLSTLALVIAMYPIWSITWLFLWHAFPANLPQPYHFLHIAGTWRALVFTLVTSALAVAATTRTMPAFTRWRLLLDASIMADSRESALEKRVSEVTAARTDTADAAAQELRRIERDLHDGPQARLAALGMELGLAEQLMARDPAAAASLIAEARANATTALSDIRGVIRGVHPPVLADRGLQDAIRALVVDLPLPMALELELPGRLAPPLESALYFSVSECLANTLKHSHATRAWVSVRQVAQGIRVEVGDDGIGGALAGGAGLRGIERRLAAFDGMMSVTSPAGVGTRIEVEVPCEPSSRRTTPSFGTDSSGS